MEKSELQLDYKSVQLILPMDYEQIIDDCDSVVSFKEVVGGLNLRKYITTSSKGRHEYDPEVMLQLILFGFMENIRSLRQLEKACRTDIRFLYLGDRIKPSSMAFQRFIDTKLKTSIDEIFTVINQFLIEKEAINTQILSVDGTKIEANVRKISFAWKKAILNYQSKLFIKITKQLRSLRQDLPGFHYDIQDSYQAGSLTAVCQQLEAHIEKEGINFVYGQGHRKSRIQRHYELLKKHRILH